MVKIELGKRDFILVAFLVVLIGVGFVYAYGGNNPNVMGHGGGEISLDGDTVISDAFCQKITGNACGDSAVAPYCGDGSCNNGETISGCCEDCGTVVTVKSFLDSYGCCANSPGECITNVDGVVLCYGDSYPARQCSTCSDSGISGMVDYCVETRSPIDPDSPYPTI